MIKRVSTGYKPRVHQVQVHKNKSRFKVVLAHRRFGKTHLALNEITDHGFRNMRKNPQYAYIAPTYGQAKRVAWDLLKDYLKEIPGVVFNEADLRAEIPRPATGDKIKIMLLGAENPGSIRGIYLDGVVLDEYAECSPVIWTEVVRATLMDREGWAIFIGTPKGQNHFYEIYNQAVTTEGWAAFTFKASETGVIPISELEMARATMAENEYAQEFECSFQAALVGAYFGKEMEKARASGRITKVPYDPSLPVFTFWDLGISDTTVIWFGQVLRGREIRWINYVEESGQGLDYYAKVLRETGYVFDEHVLPHDGGTRELGTGRSRQETLQALTKGVRIRVLGRDNVADGINAARMMIAKSWFDEEKCKKGIAALENYERAWDAKNKIFQERPKHNWASHGADAFRTAAMGLDENRPDADKIKRYARHSDNEYSVV